MSLTIEQKHAEQVLDEQKARLQKTITRLAHKQPTTEMIAAKDSQMFGYTPHLKEAIRELMNNPKHFQVKSIKLIKKVMGWPSYAVRVYGAYIEWHSGRITELYAPQACRGGQYFTMTLKEYKDMKPLGAFP